MPVPRRRFLSLSLSALAASARPLRAHAQAAGLRVLRRNVGLFVGPGGTIGWLATPDGVVVVDSQFPASAEACRMALRERSAAPLQALINTHHHGDHTAGNKALRPAVQRIVQHERCAAALGGGADVTFTDTWSVEVGGERVSAVHLGAAHTAGDALVHFERANIVHLGDLVFNRIPPFIDRASGGSILAWVKVLQEVESRYAGVQFVFGHGRDERLTGTVADVRRFRNYLEAALAHVRQGIAAGRSKTEIGAATALPGFEDHGDLVKNYTSPIPLFTLNHVLSVAYDELTTR